MVGLDKAEISTAKDTDRKFEDVLEKIREQSGACLCIGSPSKSIEVLFNILNTTILYTILIIKIL